MADYWTRIFTEPTEVGRHTEKGTDSVSSRPSVRSVLHASPGLPEACTRPGQCVR